MAEVAEVEQGLGIGIGAEIELRSAGSPKETTIETPAATPAATPPASQTTPASTGQPAGDGKNKVDENGQATGQSTPSGVQQQSTAAADDIPEEKFTAHLSKLTGGGVKSLDEITTAIKERNELKDQVAKGLEPKHSNERTKWAYELFAKNPGVELQALQRTLRAVSFDGNGKSDKDWLFEAYLLDPKNADLSLHDAGQYFEAEHNKRFADAEGAEPDLLKKRELQLAVKDAKESIGKIQTEFSSHEEAPKKIAQEVEQAVQSAADNFKGLKFKFKEDTPENEIFNVPMNDPTEAQFLKQSILNPHEAYDDFVRKFETPQGFDYEGFVKESYVRQNAVKLIKLASDHYFKLGQLSKINEIKNQSGKQIDQIGTPGAGQVDDSFAGAWSKAAGQR